MKEWQVNVLTNAVYLVGCLHFAAVFLAHLIQHDDTEIWEYTVRDSRCQRQYSLLFVGVALFIVEYVIAIIYNCVYGNYNCV